LGVIIEKLQRNGSIEEDPMNEKSPDSPPATSVKSRLIRLKINSLRVYLERFMERAGRSLPAEGMVLDAGAGDSPYRRFFVHAQYESADFCQVDGAPYTQVTYVSDLASLPVADDRYDMIVCTQVLEHVPDPRKVLCEFQRILKKGGELWLSAPLYYTEHQIPYDFYRYTQYGLRKLLDENGFEVMELERLEGYYGTLAYQFESAAKGLPTHPQKYGGGLLGTAAALFALPMKPFLWLLYLAFSRLDLRYKNTADGHCKNYTVVARKI
jgi:SAM-dependent methyltransferase